MPPHVEEIFIHNPILVFDQDDDLSLDYYSSSDDESMPSIAHYHNHDNDLDTNANVLPVQVEAIPVLVQDQIPIRSSHVDILTSFSAIMLFLFSIVLSSATYIKYYFVSRLIKIMALDFIVSNLGVILLPLN